MLDAREIRPLTHFLTGSSERIRAGAPDRAEKWLAGLFAAIVSLEDMPVRCPLIPEAKELGFAARQLLYGKDRGVYRITFCIREEGRHVRILRIWHSSAMQLPLTTWSRPPPFGIQVTEEVALSQSAANSGLPEPKASDNYRNASRPTPIRKPGPPHRT
jgi:plasmid stabilization system protein ParE